MPDARPLPVHAVLAAATALVLTACGAAPHFTDELEAAAACLDSARPDEAVDRLAVALTVAPSNHDRVQVLAMQVEAQLARDDVEQAAFAVEQARLIAPAAFLAWKAQAVLDLRRLGTDAARAALSAAKGRVESAGQGTWSRDFERLLDALDAFRDGDLNAARTHLVEITHADVAPSAAWLRARLDAVELVHAQRIGAAGELGAREGLLDLWHAARDDRSAQERVLAYGRQIGGTLEPSCLRQADVQARARLAPSPLAVASVAAVARIALEQVPLRSRSDS